MTALVPRRILALREEIKRLAAEERLALVDLFEPCELRRLRDIERMETIAALLQGRKGDVSEIARQVRADLRLYLTSGWQRDKHHEGPADPRHQAMFDFLRASDGDLPSFRTLRRHASNLATCSPPRGQQSIEIEHTREIMLSEKGAKPCQDPG